MQHLESHHVSSTELQTEILHRIWYYDKLCPNDGMFKLAIRNKFNTAAATKVYCICFQGIIQSPLKIFYTKCKSYTLWLYDGKFLVFTYFIV